jgi:glutathione S-transferase
MGALFQRSAICILLGHQKGGSEMSPEDIKDLKIILATWKFEITETIEEKFKQIITNNKERWNDEQARRRERSF